MNARRWFGFNRFAVVAVALAACGTGGAMAQGQDQMQDQMQGQGQQQDPPDRIARVSFLQGDVSLQPASQNGDAAFTAAEMNYTLTAGDRLYTGPGGLSELQSDNLALRLGRLSDVTLQSFSPEYVQLGLAQGSVRVRSYALQTNAGIEIDTSNGAFTVLRAGDVRVSSYPGNGQRPDTTIVSVQGGEVRAVGNGVDTLVESGQTLRMDGNNPAQMQFVEMLPQDELDEFDQQRDAQRASAAGEIRDQYVNPEMVGYDDLTTYGDWAPDPDYGQVWYPRQIDAGWSPYHNGHWAYIAPWGYTWVEAEPWGFAPFHYGRWAQFRGRWGWVPGPAVVRPVYSPALVAFVGGGGISVTAWFPLGPREPFVPWYRSSPGYVNRVNVSNLYNRNTVEVRNVYVNRTTNLYGNGRAGNNVYINRNAGMVAVPQQAFERGQAVRGAQVRLDARQMQQAQVVNRPPEMTGRPQGPVGTAPARAVPAMQARPQFQQGQRWSGNGGQRFGQGANQQQQGQQPGQQQGQPAQGRPQQQQQQGAPNAPARIETRPVPGAQTPVAPTGPTQVRTPGGMRPQNPGNSNPDLAPSQPRGNAQPQQQQPQQQQQQQVQPGRNANGQDLVSPVGGGRNNRPADENGARPATPVQSVPLPPTQVRTPGGMRPQNPGNSNPDLAPSQPRGNFQPQQQQQVQPGRNANGQDLANPVGGGRNNRPADGGGARPAAPATAPAPTTAPARTPGGVPNSVPVQQQPQRPNPPQTQQARPQGQAQPQQQQRPAPQVQRQAPAPKAEPRKEEPK